MHCQVLLSDKCLFTFGSAGVIIVLGGKSPWYWFLARQRTVLRIDPLHCVRLGLRRQYCNRSCSALYRCSSEQESPASGTLQATCVHTQPHLLGVCSWNSHLRLGHRSTAPGFSGWSGHAAIGPSANQTSSTWRPRRRCARLLEHESGTAEPKRTTIEHDPEASPSGRDPQNRADRARYEHHRCSKQTWSHPTDTQQLRKRKIRNVRWHATSCR